MKNLRSQINLRIDLFSGSFVLGIILFLCTVFQNEYRYPLWISSAFFVFLSGKNTKVFGWSVILLGFSLGFNFIGFDYSDVLVFFVFGAGVLWRKITLSLKITPFTVLFLFFSAFYILSNVFNAGILSLQVKFWINALFFVVLINSGIFKTNLPKSIFMMAKLFLLTCAISYVSVMLNLVPKNVFMDIIRSGRFHGYLGDPNILALICSFYACFVFFCLLERRIPVRLTNIIILLGLCSILIFTDSRAGWVNFAFTVFSYLFIAFIRNRPSLIVRFSTAAFVSVSLLFVILTQTNTVQAFGDRIAQFVVPNSDAESDRMSFTFTRAAFALGVDNPFGLGTGQTERNEKMPFESVEENIQAGSTKTIGAHNSFVQILSDNGWGSFLFLILILLSIFYRLYIRSFQSDYPFSPLALALFSGLMVNGMFHDLIGWTLTWFVLLSTLALGDHRNANLVR
jgi:hypothetical protein